MSTYFQEITNSISTVVIDGVLNYLESRDIDISSITAEDIAEYLGTQYNPRGGKAAGGFSGVPAAKKTASASSGSDGSCCYVYTRGANADNPCGKPANGKPYGDSPRCKAHTEKPGKDENAAPKSKTASKPTAKPGAPKAPVPRPAPPASAPRRDAGGVNRPVMRAVPNHPGLMYDTKTMVVVNSAEKKVVGIYADDTVKHYLPAEQRKSIANSSFEIPEDLPEEEEIVFEGDGEAEAEGEAVEGDGEAEAEAEADGESETAGDDEPEPEPVKRPAPPAVKRPTPAPPSAKRPVPPRG